MAKLKILMATRTHMEKMMAMDHRVNSIYSYRLQTSQDPLGWGLTFQRVKLPREVTIKYPRDENSLLRSWADADLIYAGMLEDLLVAYVTLEVKTLPKTARICDLVVTPEVRLKGVATTMIAASEDWAAKKKLDRVLIELPMRNFPAISLALKCGYGQCGFLDQYFPNSDPALFFEKRLGS